MQETQLVAKSRTVGYLAAVVVAVGLFCLYANGEKALANQTIAPVAGSNGIVTHVLESEGRPTRVILIDPASRVMAVYEIGREKAEIKWLSSRNFSYDMQMIGHNSVDPAPEDVKKMLEMQ